MVLRSTNFGVIALDIAKNIYALRNGNELLKCRYIMANVNIYRKIGLSWRKQFR